MKPVYICIRTSVAVKLCLDQEGQVFIICKNFLSLETTFRIQIFKNSTPKCSENIALQNLAYFVDPTKL